MCAFNLVLLLRGLSVLWHVTQWTNFHCYVIVVDIPVLCLDLLFLSYTFSAYAGRWLTAVSLTGSRPWPSMFPPRGVL